jgi:sugar/nucleoside kinase (ribokinase family)/HD-like signal output (HDOD) protein
MTQNRHPSVDRLLAAIRKSGEFPAMAKTVGLISSLTSSEATSSGALADTILQDYGLTQKVLRLVNTVAYAQYDEITTVTRAVLLMGFERIRAIATGLLLFEHLQKQARTESLVNTLNMSFFSAVLGRNIADNSGFADTEEAFICALFHRLGRLLVAFYLPEDYEVIQSAEDGKQDLKAREVLGLTFQEMGVAVADELGLPQKLSDSMVRVPGSESRRVLSPGERLGCVATLANDITDVLSAPDDPRKKCAEIDRLLASYGSQITITWKVDDLIAKSVKELKESSTAFKLELPGSRFMWGIGEWSVASLVSPGASAAGLADASSAGALVPEIGSDESGTPAKELPETILTKGLHEITSLLVSDYTLDDVLKVTLETIYRALGVGKTRVFFLLKDPSTSVARFRFGFGQSTGEMKPWFEIPISGAEDLFSLSFTHQKDIVIKDATAAEVVRALPDWFTSRGVPDRYMVLLPLVVDQKSVGLFYVDGEKAGLAALTPAVLNDLKVLRGQAVLAIRRESRPGLGPPMTPPRLLVIGDIAWDVLMRPSGDLVWGADVYGHVDLLAGGSAANVAVWAKRLGASATLVGQVGEDRLGELMLAHLQSEGVADFVRVVAGGQTMRIGVVVRPDAEHAFITDHSQPLRLTADDVPPMLLDGVDAVFLNGYAVFMAGSASFASALLAEARHRGILVAFDPSSFSLIRAYGPTRLLDEIGRLDILLANGDEARALLPGESLSGLLARAAVAVVKQGGQGATALHAEGSVSAAADPITVTDTTGAGDAFDAAFLVEYLAHRDLARALAAANRLGGQVASRLGAQTR